MRFGRAWPWLCALCVLAAGCKNSPKGGAARGPAPDYATVAAAYNGRVSPLDRLWATTTVRVWFPNQQGEEEQAQVEGHLQYLSPWRFSLTFEKLGEIHAALGSNEQNYWWLELDMVKTAHVGSHAKVTPERIAKLGVPVHPLDLVEALGITPLPPPDGKDEVRWSDDGRSLVVTVEGRMGRRRLWLDPATYEPSRVQVLGPDGAAVIAAELEKYERVEAAGQQGPRIATRVLVSAQREKIRIRLTLGDAEMSASRPKAKAFDLDFLLKAYEIKQVDDLDAPPPQPAGG